MKLARLAVSIASMALLPAALAQTPPGGGILGTAHDFASTVAGANLIPNVVPGGVGLCTYCHTPHRAYATLLLWNHTLSSNTFSWDVPKTTAGTNFPAIPGGTYKGPTTKCLSCHDGSVAVGDIAWYKEQAWSGAGAASTFKMGGIAGNGDDTSHFLIGVGGAMKGNHPVAMPYSYNQAANTYNAITGGTMLVLTEWQPDPTTLASAHIRLFNDDGAGNISAGPVAGKTGIECSSCHDPHNKAAIDNWFLRGNAQGSTQADGYICLQCHIK